MLTAFLTLAGALPASAGTPGLFSTIFSGSFTGLSASSFSISEFSFISTARSHGDAYDGWANVFVDQSAIPSNQYSGVAMDFTNEFYSGSQKSMSGLQVSVSGKFSSSFMGFSQVVRLENPTVSSISVNVRVTGNLGSDRSEIMRGTSSGDTILTTSDNWAVSSDSSNSDPLVSLAWGDGLGQLRPTSVTLGTAGGDPGDNSSVVFAVNVPAGAASSILLMHGVGGVDTQSNDPATVVSRVGALFADGNSIPSELLSAYTPQQLSEIVNWGFAPGLKSVSSSPNPTSSLTQTFDIEFSQLVTGFDADDVGFIGSAGGCAIDSLTGSGSQYQLNVSACSDGTLGLQIASNAVLGVSGQSGPGQPFQSDTILIDRGAPTLAMTSPSSPNNASILTFDLTSSETLPGVEELDFSVSGTNCSVGAPTGPTGSAPNLIYSVPVSGCDDGQAVTLTLLADAVADAAGNTAPSSDIVSASVVVDRTAPTGTISIDPITNDDPLKFQVTLSESITTSLDVTRFTVTESSGASSCQIDSVTAVESGYEVSVGGCDDQQNVTLAFVQNGLTDLAGNTGPPAISGSTTATVAVDRSYLTPTITAPASPNNSASFDFTLGLQESTSDLSSGDFELLEVDGTTCEITEFGVPTPLDSQTSNFGVSVSGCSHGDEVALRLKANSVYDALINSGPAENVDSTYVLVDLVAPELIAIAPTSGALTNQSTVQYNLSFSETVEYLD